MHKMINGIRIQLTPEEETEILLKRKEGKKNDIEEEAKEAAKVACCASANEKLVSLGFTEQEIALFNL